MKIACKIWKKWNDIFFALFEGTHIYTEEANLRVLTVCFIYTFHSLMQGHMHYVTWKVYGTFSRITIIDI